MKTYIALLRSINVGGKNKVPMAELRAVLTRSGFNNVRTYIQSGNVILETSKPLNEVKELIKTVIKTHFGFEITVLVKTNNELQLIYDRCPFVQNEKEKSYFMMLDTIPNQELIDEVKKLSYEDEAFHIIENCIYFYSKNGYGRTKFNSNFFESKLKVSASARNYNTMMKLLSLSSRT